VDEFKATRAFVRVVQARSFSAVANSEGTTQSAVSKNVLALEEQLGCQLLVRSTQSLSLTEAGEEYYRRSLKILEELEKAKSAVRLEGQSLQGTLRVSMSPVLSRIIFAPLVAEFSIQNPDLRVSMMLTERHCDLIAEGIDVVIRASQLEDSSLIARKLSSNPLSVAAAPSYLQEYGVPEHPSQLEDHSCLTFSRFEKWRTWKFRQRGGSVAVKINSNIVADQGDSLVELAALGCGIVMMPKWVMRDHLRDGRLKLLLENWRCPQLPLYVVYPRAKYQPTKIRRFSSFIYSTIRERNLLPR